MKYYISDLFKKYFDGPIKYSKFHCDFKATIKNEFLKTKKASLKLTHRTYDFCITAFF